MKTLPLFLGLAVLSASCSKEVKNYYLQEKSSSEKLEVGNDKKNTDLLKDILESSAPNLALADLIARSMSKEEREVAKDLIYKLSPEEIREILNRVGQDNNSIRGYYFFKGQKYQANEEYIKNSLVNPNDLISQAISIEDQIRISAFTYIKDKTLTQIIETYEARVKTLSKDLALLVASDIAEKDPRTAQDVEKLIRDGKREQAIKMISSARPFIEKMDRYFKTSNLSENEQYAVVGAGLVAGAIYAAVKDNDGFKHIVEEVKRIAKDIEEFKSKAKEFTVLVKALDKHIDDTEKNLVAFKDGVTGMKNDLKEVYENARTRPSGSTVAGEKQAMNFLFEKIIQGRDVKSAGTNPSILSKQVRINENLSKSVTAVGNISENLSNILTTTESMFKLVGIKPSKDLQKVINGAQKVAAVVSSVKSIAVGFAAGGPLGAMAAFSSSPILSSLMGGGGGQDSAMLKEINKKLNIIIDNQKKMMEMQMETMKMIKDLALMVDKYHQDEMRALAELRDINLVNQEIVKSLVNKDIRSCERMINFQLSSVWKQYNFETDSFYGINDLKLVNTKFMENISSFGDIQRITQSVESNGFERCQNGIADAFSGNSTLENPIRGIFASSENENLYSFQRDKYLPLLDLFYSFTETTSLDSIPLHLPAMNYAGLKDKYIYMKDAKNTSVSNSIYELDELVSVKSLERYLTQLLVLYPVLEVDKEIWAGTGRDVVDEYLKNANTNNNQNMRSYYYLSNALELVQSAIAQEALLAGEPLLPFLIERHHAEIFSAKDCKTVATSMAEVHTTPSICIVRENKLLMKNYVTYFLNWKKERYSGNFNWDYKTAYETQDLNKLSAIFNSEISVDRFKVTKEDIFILVKNQDKNIEIRIPKPDEFDSERLMYSEYMSRLVKMQNAVIEALEKVTPYNRVDKSRGTDLYNAILINVR